MFTNSNSTPATPVLSSPEVSESVMLSMFNHLTASYPEDEAREILAQKYPNSAEVLASINADNYRVTTVDMGTVVKVVEPAGAPDLLTAVKTKVAKVKTPKAPVEPKAESKADRARAMYAAAEDKSRGAMIALFIAELGMSKAGASTYYYSVKG